MSKATRQRTARERLAADRKRQAQRDQRTRAVLITVFAVVLVVAVVGVGLYLANKKAQRSQVASAYKGPLAPVSRESDGSLVMSAQGVSAPLLEIFEDFQCPGCKGFEAASGGVIKKLAAEGKVKVVYHPFQLFQTPGDPKAANSQRAANAAACTPADKWVSYHDALYKFQPPEGSAGFATKDLVAWGKDLGITDQRFATCVGNLQQQGQVAQMTQYVRGRGVASTPTVFLDGKKLEQGQFLEPNALEQTIGSARRNAPGRR